MKLFRLRGICWRIHAPRWAHLPLSGDGAAKTGGRFNQPGMPALYLALDHGTAIREYGQDLGWRPGTLCAYRVDVRVADLRDETTLAALGFDAPMVRCPWKQLAFQRRPRPVPSWKIAGSLIAQNVPGAIYPSAVDRAGSNLVLWRWNSSRDDRVEVLDPLGELPRDPS